MMGDFTHLAASLVPWNRKSKSYSTQDSGAEVSGVYKSYELTTDCPHDMSLAMSCFLIQRKWKSVLCKDSLVRI